MDTLRSESIKRLNFANIQGLRHSIFQWSTPSQEIHRHLKDHLAAEEFSRDLKLAQEIEAAPPTTPPKEIFHQVEGGLMDSLKNCLASGSEKDATRILSGYVNHFQSRDFEDVVWVVDGQISRCLALI